MLESKNSKNISNDLKNTKIVGFYAVKQWEKNIHFQEENISCSSLARTISASRRSFFANMTTFERPSGLKKKFPSQNRDFGNGVIVKISKS